MLKNVDIKMFGNIKDDILNGLENDINLDIDGNIMNEMLQKNIDF